MGEFNLDDHYIYYCGEESFRRNRIALIVNKRVQNAVLGCSLKNNRVILVHFQGKSFNITVIQVYATNTDAEETEFDGLYEDMRHLLELIPKIGPFHYRTLENKNRKLRDTWNNSQVCP